MLYVVIVGDTAILCNLLMKSREQYMCLVSVSKVRRMHGVVEVRSALVLIISTPIDIVKLEACTKLLPCVNGILGREMVLTICPVAGRVVAKVCER